MQENIFCMIRWVLALKEGGEWGGGFPFVSSTPVHAIPILPSDPAHCEISVESM